MSLNKAQAAGEEKTMRLPDVYGYGQLFAYSGLDGMNSYLFDIVGTLLHKPIGFRLEFKEWYKLFYDIKGDVKYNAVTGDMIDANIDGNNLFITFKNFSTIVGKYIEKPIFESSEGVQQVVKDGVDIRFSPFEAVGLAIREEDGGFKFSLSVAQSIDEARAGANRGLNADLDALKEKRYDYFRNLPPCKSDDPDLQRLYYKAASVNKVNVFSPQGTIPCTWTTPDRVPHKRMWLWDSVFHAIGFLEYNKELAKDAVWAVLSQQWEDGFIPLMIGPVDFSDVTQPPLLGWGVWEIYKATGDKEFLKKCAPRIKGYLQWDIDNRDANGNKLLEWKISEYEECRSGESGMDNSPRFDLAVTMDAVDFSSYLMHDALMLSYIYDALGDKEESDHWKRVSDGIKDAVNKLLWCEKDGMYYDRDMNGNFNYVPNVASFIPLFAGVPTAEQAKRMVQNLTDPKSFWTALPVPTIPKNHPAHCRDMWRGNVWINFNYMIIVGLEKYGYRDIAKELRDKTLYAVNKWYKKYGCIYEFFNCDNEIAPFLLDRKGKTIDPPDWRIRWHSISDFNWSAALTLKMIQDV